MGTWTLDFDTLHSAEMAMIESNDAMKMRHPEMEDAVACLWETAYGLPNFHPVSFFAQTVSCY
jgi:hypothetical protein